MVSANRLAEQRWQGVRRLGRHEWERVGYEGPLTLHRLEVRFVLGWWRPTRTYGVLHSRNGVVWSGSRRELRRLGVDVAPPSRADDPER